LQSLRLQRLPERVLGSLELRGQLRGQLRERERGLLAWQAQRELQALQELREPLQPGQLRGQCLQQPDRSLELWQLDLLREQLRPDQQEAPARKDLTTLCYTFPE